MTLSDLLSLKGVHQSRNAYVARTLREVGVMRELGEGMRRIFEIMKSSELAPPEVADDPHSFKLSLHHRAIYTKEEGLWLEQYEQFLLSPEEKSIVLMGRKGDLISPNDIIRRLGIVDTEHYRQIVHSLQTKGVLESAIPKSKAQNTAKHKGIGMRDVARFKIRIARDAAQSRRPLNLIGSKLQVKSSDVEENTLYFGNIAPGLTVEEISRAVMAFGQPQNVAIPKYRGKERGYAFVQFDSKIICEKVLAAEIKIANRIINVQWKRPPEPRITEVDERTGIIAP